MYELKLSDQFLIELLATPKQVQKKFLKDVRPQLERNPKESHGDTIKKLAKYKSLWRYRVGDYRIIYLVEGSTVTLLKVGDRKTVYSAFPDPATQAGQTIVAHNPELLEPRPRPREIHAAQQALNAQSNSDQQLPRKLTTQTLNDLGIAENLHDVLLSCTTDGDILDCQIPDEARELVVEYLYPSKAGDVLNVPLRSGTVDDATLEQFLDGERELTSILLALDEDQKPFVRRFKQLEPVGPWLLKGGPGSGKSTIAIYCIAALLRSARERLVDRKPKVFFTTYTNSLTQFSGYLLDCLDPTSRDQVTVSTVNSEATSVVRYHRGGGDIPFCEGNEFNALVNDVLVELAKQGQQSTFSITDGKATATDVGFVQDEITWVILGQDCADSLDKYLTADRAGRGRTLRPNQREDVYRVFQQTRQRLKTLRKTTHPELLWWASKLAQPRYDYVFIDEAQDLPPAVLRFCVKLSRDPKNVFLTADINQSIWGRGVSWGSISDALRFRGRSTILKKNYRSTRPILHAIEQIAEGLTDSDKETLQEAAVYDGEVPQLCFVRDNSDEIDQISNFLDRSALRTRCGYRGCAVLCYRKEDALRVAKALPPRMNARFLSGRNDMLEHSGVKVLTMHGSKGLEFPAVVVAGLEDRVFPPRLGIVDDAEAIRQSLRRLFFVACSRAMKRLILTAPKDNPSEFVLDLTEDRWEIVGR